MAAMRVVAFDNIYKIVVEHRHNTAHQPHGRDCLGPTGRGRQKIPAGSIPGHEFVGTVHEVGV
ncbi:uncharacterized protein N7500_008158 [Penicillium coprophilum]|uniref:uncharacterized protein n=1 Tax=Penicillium coprophilum TaxID=36646 RepID=UPI00239D1CFF|nr:uncharacterized protein N7500_008158 [Penicillium coprophilum]KAJ5158507.1 hypothetical protein N7500_008158 [Penicillium coprophilum]